ncbi:Non-specific serine/threonine protein kinase [Bertholletia excelsa]
MLLTSVVVPGDNVLAVHVMESDDSFDPNYFHIHEDLCKSKQVDFQVKACGGGSYVRQLAHQVRINFATILAVGCSYPGTKNSMVSEFLKALPPTCSLLVMDSAARILVQRQGTSQEGSVTPVRVLRSSLSSISQYNNGSDQSDTSRPQIQKSLTMPSSSNLSSYQLKPQSTRKQDLVVPNLMTQKLFQGLAMLEIKGSGRRFTSEELSSATNGFSQDMVIGEGRNSRVYLAELEDGRAAAVKVLKDTESSLDDLFSEVETLSGLKHENVVQLFGYCYGKGMNAIVYNFLNGSLKQRLGRMKWRERMRVAIGVAKALEYLHSRSPPVIHRDVKSSNILLSDNCHPQLSDFGAAMAYDHSRQLSGYTKPFQVFGTFGHLAPEYVMYGKVDEKIDVYSYGVVLLELISGKWAIQTNKASNPENFVLWARSLLCFGLSERLIDPYLNEDYDKDEMTRMMIVARLCLLHSSSRRPTIETILQLLEKPEHCPKMQRKREELLNGISPKTETGLQEDLDSNGTLSTEDG